MSPKWKAHTFIQPVVNVIPDKKVLVWSSRLFLYLQPPPVGEESSLYPLLSFEEPRIMPFLPQVVESSLLELAQTSSHDPCGCRLLVPQVCTFFDTRDGQESTWGRVYPGHVREGDMWGGGAGRRLDCGVGGSPQPSRSFWGSVKVISLLAKKCSFYWTDF